MFVGWKITKTRSPNPTQPNPEPSLAHPMHQRMGAKAARLGHATRAQHVAAAAAATATSA
jgi:hypothetical protein